MNEIVNDFDTDNISSSDILAEGISPQAYDYYDYDYRSYLQTIINNQNELKTKIDKSNDICNAGFTTLLFCLSSAFMYVLVKNYIRK